MKFDPTKPVRTRSGEPAEIIYRDRPGLYPIVALTGEAKAVATFTKGGRFGVHVESPHDLVNVPEERTIWLNIYRGGRLYTHDTEERARAERSPNIVAFKKLTYIEGEGL